MSFCAHALKTPASLPKLGSPTCGSLPWKYPQPTGWVFHDHRTGAQGRVPYDSPYRHSDLGSDDPDLLAKQAQSIPWERAAQPSEIARLAVFPASSDADYVTNAYVMNGGLMRNLGQRAVSGAPELNSPRRLADADFGVCRAMRRSALSPMVLSVVLLAGLTACTAGPPTAPGASPPTAAPPAPPPAATAAGGYADLVARAEPSVVTVRTDAGLGSGVVFRPDVVLTNQHVVAGASQVTIGYADGTSSPGTVLATDVVTDLALIRTERTGLPVPEYRVELPRPGDVALALGSPLGFEGTVTAGIVSGLSRDIPGSAAQTQSLVDLIQTDAAISPGNSGGALIDTAGRVIGINEAYIPPDVGAVSIGFAIPSATAVDVAEQLLVDGTADHPYLGVSLSRLTPAIRQSLGVRSESGVLVLGVDPGGPAASAGVLEGDVITALVGQPVDSLEELLGTLRGTEPGKPVSITIERGGELRTVTVTIGRRSS